MTQPIGGNNISTPGILPRSSQVITRAPAEGRAFNRSISVKSDVTPSVSPANKDSAAGSGVFNRTVSSISTPESYLAPAANYSDVLTPEEFTKEAGEPGKVFNSATYKGLITELKNYHKKASSPLSEQITSLGNLKNKAKTFFNKKANETIEQGKQGDLSEKKAKRIKGTSVLLSTIYSKKQSLIQQALNEMKHASRAEESEKIAHLFQNCTISEIADAIVALPAQEQQNILSSFLGKCDACLEDRTLATKLVLEIINQQGGAPDIVTQYTPDLMSAMSQGTVDQCAENVYMVHQAGILNLEMVAIMGQNQIMQLSSIDNFETVVADFTALMDSVDRSAQEGSPTLEHCNSHALITPDRLTGKPVDQKTFAAQATLIFKDRMLKLGGDNPGFKHLVQTWDNFCMHDMPEYNESVPSKKQVLDVSQAAFNKEFAKLDSKYFTQVANGEPIDSASKGWKPIGENWQQADNAKGKSREEVISDFFFHNAPGIKH